MPLSSAALSEFVPWHSIDPSIHEHLAYTTALNFTGAPVTGYEGNPRALLTKPAAEALSRAQAIFKEMGYSLVIYDAYRPQKAVDSFKAWSLSTQENPQMKAWFYPEYTHRPNLFTDGFITEKSSHSRGSTFDGTLIALGKTLHPIQPEERILADGTQITFLNDGTVDMGTHLDNFGKAAWTDSVLVTPEQQGKRKMFREVLTSCGFVNLPKEWWHFTLQPEPFPDTYFDFAFDAIIS